MEHISCHTPQKIILEVNFHSFEITNKTAKHKYKVLSDFKRVSVSKYGLLSREESKTVGKTYFYLYNAWYICFILPVCYVYYGIFHWIIRILLDYI